MLSNSNLKSSNWHFYLSLFAVSLIALGGIGLGLFSGQLNIAGLFALSLAATIGGALLGIASLIIHQWSHSAKTSAASSDILDSKITTTPSRPSIGNNPLSEEQRKAAEFFYGRPNSNPSNDSPERSLNQNNQLVI